MVGPLAKSIGIEQFDPCAAGRRDQALNLLDTLPEREQLEHYLPFHVARGAALHELERRTEALLAYQRALELARNSATIRHLSGAIDQIRSS